MRLVNFHLEQPYSAVMLIGLGHEWDLHSYANFVRLEYDALDDVLIMEWKVEPGDENPWSSRGNTALGCRLHYQGVRLLSMACGTTQAEDRDRYCLSGVSKVVLEDGEFRFKDHWQDDEPFRLLFSFESGHRIEVEADPVSLEAVGAAEAERTP